MTTALTPSPADPSGNTLLVPSGGDARTAASIQVPFQNVLNSVMWLYGVLAGSISASINIIGGITTSSVTASGAISAGSVTATGVVSGRIRPTTVFGDFSGITHTYDPTTTNYVMSPLVSISAGCVWQIANTGSDGDMMTFSSFDSANAVTLKDPSGATIDTLRYTTGNTYQITVVLKSGNWQKMLISKAP